MKDLATQKLIVPPEHTVIYRLFMEKCRLNGVKPDVACVGFSETNSLIMGQNGSEICILPDCVAEEKLPENMKIIPVLPEMLWYVNLLYWDSPGNKAKELWDYIRQNYNQ